MQSYKSKFSEAIITPTVKKEGQINADDIESLIEELETLKETHGNLRIGVSNQGAVNTDGVSARVKEVDSRKYLVF